MGFWSGRNILLGISGGIAAYKALELIRRLRQEEARVTVVTTANALRFVTPLCLEALSGGPVHSDLFSLEEERQMGHIRLAREAELVILAPATADLLSRMACGRADELLTALLLARQGPILAAPAMNHAMWSHPATQANVARLKEWGVAFVGPESGPLACGEEGEGRLATPENILEAARRRLTPKPLSGKRLLITAGPTREALDPVRYLSNHSSGRMGWATALGALRLGAEVTLVHGPVALEPPPGARCVAVESARQMAEATLQAWPDHDAAILTAAVGDFRPQSAAETKIKKIPGHETWNLELVQNPDILAELTRRRRPGQVVAGFAAETGPESLSLAREKLQRKGCDWLAVNDVAEPGSGFGVATNRLTLLFQDGREEPWPLLSKEEAGERLARTAAAWLSGGRPEASAS
ncbi:MAG: bifunctional phosphopantothenoylcysteine decarboxylase/phosphopantothenate--cysteine ligase CoaBC [Magnetococcales bacterium]|nr:bifunctional phosphopantothenoylcysteine decarboxylase/phosphopantothenate--cysteine ligase CoaBC [Magnetococcales bacterium]